MSTIDLSRDATDPRKRYAGVRMQQGRVLTDDDFNEAAVLDAEEMRRTRLDAIGAYGAGDAGFLLKDFAMLADLGVAAPGRPTFKLAAGTVYLGGLRVEMQVDEWFHLQKDWLNFDPAADWPTAPAAGQSRIDLAWIEVWQQPVTAVEDAELYEVALGGADTSVRMRTMRRVRLATGIAETDCAAAWAAAKTGFAALGTIAADMELQTQAKLQVAFSAPASAVDLCSPPVPGGYLGAENQAIRVQLVSPTHYTWGHDNGSPLYRVQILSKNGQRIVVKMINQPKDAVHWPLQGQVAEILPWSAALANGETVADLSGHFSKIAVSYNPDDDTFELTTQVPAGFGEAWKLRSDKSQFFDGTTEDDYLFLRMWNRGDDLTSTSTIPVGNGQLGNTGFTVSFIDGPLRAHDYWIIAARPATPDQVVPWVLEAVGGAPGHGLKRYRAPLGLIEWTNAGGVVTGKLIHDCRPPFLPLTKIRGCCSVSVGDGTNSFGHFTSINAAIASLPPTGGTVCVLPGVYRESVSISARKNIVVHGCGPRSRIVAQEASGVALPAVSIVNSTDITIESLALEGGPAAVVHIEEDCRQIRIADNLVQMRDEQGKAGVWPAIFTRGDDVAIEANIVQIMTRAVEFGKKAFNDAHTARGGIQIGGGSERVVVRDNRISGGIGNGITLGSLLMIDQGHPNGIHIPDLELVDECAPCEPNDNTIPIDDDPQAPRYVSAGDLYDIEIVDNLIFRHGANGIGVVRFFILSEASAEFVVVHGLLIERNRILQNLRRDIANIRDVFRLFVGYGGISLAVCERLQIVDNDIIDNGIDRRSPVCGIFALRADGLRIEHNRIESNGKHGGNIAEAQTGVRAGIHLWRAGPTIASSSGNASFVKTATATGCDQVRIHANHVVQPLGRALFLFGDGAMSITNNRLVSQAAGEPVSDLFADTVLVANIGISKEWTQGLVMALFVLIALKLYGDTAAGSYAKALCTLANLARFTRPLKNDSPSGKLQFNDNQVSFLMQEEAPLSFALSSVLLISADDVGVCDNQFEHHSAMRVLLTDVLAAGFTLRSNDNRIAETWGRAFVSLFSLAMLNTAADNQTTHCIAVYGLRKAVHHNLTLAEAFCDDACDGGSDFVGGVALGAAAMAYNG
jgi:Family of unknown function (DUF6519)/Right handed beta helix region